MQKSSGMNQFAEQIKEWMNREGMTLRAVAAMIGMDHGNLSKILSGQQGVTITRAEEIANRCGFEFCVNLKKSEKIGAS
jgi:transcriptional regulator with XRE-family HTH domain